MKNEESKPSFPASCTTTTQVENPNISPGNNKSSVPLPQSLSEKDLINVNEDKTFPPGYRFCPTDYELVMDYLKLKVLNEPLPWNKMVDVDLYSECPEILTGFCFKLLFFNFFFSLINGTCMFFFFTILYMHQFDSLYCNMLIKDSLLEVKCNNSFNIQRFYI
jgi:hypothetical protein